jgi:hypothetical protein
MRSIATRRRPFATTAALIAMVALATAGPGAALAAPGLDPSSVEATIKPGGSLDVAKTVHTPAIPPIVDVCLLEDETGSFIDDIGNLQAPGTAAAIFATVTAASPGANFAVAGFQDYPVTPFGISGDHVYQLLSSMSPSQTDWLNGIAALSIPSLASGGDLPEAQYDAIVAATGPGTFNDPTLGEQADCGWRDVPNVTHVLVVATDAAFHVPADGGPHVNDQTSTEAALGAAGRDIRVIGLKAPGAGGELDALAAATGGSVQPLSSDGMNIGAAIVAGLGNLPIEVGMASNCSDPISTTFAPATDNVTSGDDAHFTETISVAADAAQGQTFECDDWATINGEPMTDANGDVILEHKTIHVPDVTPPTVQCIEGPNPNGKTIPPAGSTTLPGPKGGQNEDGFYQLLAVDNVDPNPKIYVADDGSSFVAGPFANGDVVKITQAPGSTPQSKKMAGVVVAHITLKGDALVYAVDASGNQSDPINCKVPPPPK